MKNSQKQCPDDVDTSVTLLKKKFQKKNFSKKFAPKWSSIFSKFQTIFFVAKTLVICFSSRQNTPNNRNYIEKSLGGRKNGPRKWTISSQNQLILTSRRHNLAETDEHILKIFGVCIQAGINLLKKFEPILRLRGVAHPLQV